MKLIFFKNEGQQYFNNLRKYADVSIISRKMGVWYLDGKKTKNPPMGVIRWRAELNYPYPTLNSQAAVILGNSKARQRKVLQEAGVTVPKTWFDEKEIEYPCLARPPRHSRGVNFHVLQGDKDLKALPKKNWYFSEWIEKEKEWRVYVGGNTCLGGFEKPVKGCLRGNLAETGSWGDLIQPPSEVRDLAIAATKILGLDFSGVDVIADCDKQYLGEVNTAPMFITEDVARIFANFFMNTDGG